jgi:hypothetical protein
MEEERHGRDDSKPFRGRPNRYQRAPRAKALIAPAAARAPCISPATPHYEMHAPQRGNINYLIPDTVL